MPNVVLELSDTVFTLRGFPKSTNEKLVLILISRYIEQQALNGPTGTLRTSFQQLSRLDDERGTRRTYNQLGRVEELETHVYGVPDWDPSKELEVTCHGVEAEEIEKSWFVVYRSDTAHDVALVATLVGPNVWKGYWTFDSDEIQAIDRYVQQAF